MRSWKRIKTGRNSAGWQRGFACRGGHPQASFSRLCGQYRIIFFWGGEWTAFIHIASGLWCDKTSGDCRTAVEIDAVKQNWMGCIAWGLVIIAALCTPASCADGQLIHWVQIQSERSHDSDCHFILWIQACLAADFPSSSSSIRSSATSVCSKAAQGHTARRETCGHTRRPTGASTHSFAINRAVERPSSPHTASRFMSVFTPRRSPLSVMCKAVKRPLTHYTGKPSHSLVVLCFTTLIPNK